MTVLVEKLTKEQEIEDYVWSLDYIMALNIQLMINSIQNKRQLGNVKQYLQESITAKEELFWFCGIMFKKRKAECVSDFLKGFKCSSGVELLRKMEEHKIQLYDLETSLRR